MIIKKFRFVTTKILKSICCLSENTLIVYVYFANSFVFYYQKYAFHLSYRYTKFLAKEDDENLIPFCTAIGDPEALVEFSCARGQLSDAVLAAQVACEGIFDEMAQTDHTDKGLCNGLKPKKYYQM